MTEVDWTFSSLELPNDPNCAAGTCPHYINYLHYYRTVWANRYVKQFEFRIDSFDTEWWYDWLDYGELGGTATRLTETVAPGWRNITSSSVLQQKPFEFRFHTDSTVTRPGFSIGRARVCCQSTPGSSIPAVSLRSISRETGVLLGTNDVVYHYTNVTAAGQTTNLILWGTAGQDFDLYVRCNALPTPTVWDFRGYSSNVQEFLSWQQPGSCTYPGTWYIAVNSYSGSGQFALVVSGMYNSQDRTIRAGANFNASDAELTQFSNTLSQAGRQFYGQSEGQMLIRHVHLYNNTGATCSNCGGVPCDLCFRNEGGTGYCCDGAQVVIQQQYFGDPEGVAHEWGHQYMGVPDEYSSCATGCKWHCGHSNMANPWGSQNNMCYHVDGTNHDHNEDRSPGAGPTAVQGVWNALNNGTSVPTIWWETKDNYDYRDHDFNDAISVDRH